MKQGVHIFLPSVSKAAILACLASGCETRRVAPHPPVTAGVSLNPSAATQPRDRPHESPAYSQRQSVLAASVLGRPIEMASFGSVGPSVLVVGGIHGNEGVSVDVARELIAHLSSETSLVAKRRICIIPVANPDGYARSSRYNSHGVDLNRNFPARNFRASSRAAFKSGAAPASEPETAAILRAIDRTHPDLIISIHSITPGGQCNNYDGPAEEIARRMSRHNGYPVRASIGYPTPGSLGSYAGIDCGVPIVTLELPHNISGPNAWRDNREALLDAIAALDATPSREDVATPSQPRTRSAGSISPTAPAEP